MDLRFGAPLKVIILRSGESICSNKEGNIQRMGHLKANEVATQFLVVYPKNTSGLLVQYVDLLGKIILQANRVDHEVIAL